MCFLEVFVLRLSLGFFRVCALLIHLHPNFLVSFFVYKFFFKHSFWSSSCLFALCKLCVFVEMHFCCNTYGSHYYPLRLLKLMCIGAHNATSSSSFIHFFFFPFFLLFFIVFYFVYSTSVLHEQCHFFGIILFYYFIIVICSSHHWSFVFHFQFLMSLILKAPIFCIHFLCDL